MKTRIQIEKGLENVIGQLGDNILILDYLKLDDSNYIVLMQDFDTYYEKKGYILIDNGAIEKIDIIKDKELNERINSIKDLLKTVMFTFKG